MKVVQVLPTISYGDAVSNDAIALKKVIKGLGYDTEIYAENIDKRLERKMAVHISVMPEMNKRDVIIYHNSTGTDISFSLPKWNGRKMMIYHNITPPEFFMSYNMNAAALTEYGLDGTKYLSDKVEYCLADSEFNKQDLLRMGYKCPIDVRPILIPFDDYKKKPNHDIIAKYNDDWTNIIFVGRIAPNKKHEDIIKSFYIYKRKIKQKSRLFLVGSYVGMENYYKKLKLYVRALGLEDVYFTGHIKFNEILAYYKLADVFLCMSEHEGYCVPLVESMIFKVPIIAYESCAVPDTLGQSGVILKDKNPAFAAGTIDRLVRDEGLRMYINEKQKERLDDFSYENVKNIFVRNLDDFINGV